MVAIDAVMADRTGHEARHFLRKVVVFASSVITYMAEKIVPHCQGRSAPVF
jgi:hypothetical protein